MEPAQPAVMDSPMQKSLLDSTEDTWCWITCGILPHRHWKSQEPCAPSPGEPKFSSFSKMPFLKWSLWIKKKSNARTQSNSLLLEEAMRGELNELHICCSHYTGHTLAYKLLQICPPFPSNLLLYCLAIEMVKLSTDWRWLYRFYDQKAGGTCHLSQSQAWI